MIKSNQRHKRVPAVFLVLMKDDKILFQRRCNTGHQDGKYSLPCGHLEPKETIIEGLIREMKEEINIDIAKQDVKLVHLQGTVSDDDFATERINIYFLCKKWAGEIKNMEPEKCDDLKWFPLNKLSENMIPYIEEALKNFQKNITYSEFNW
jgi:8-oxo-dGTP diphosphatase